MNHRANYIDRLAAYEDTGLTPEDVKRVHDLLLTVQRLKTEQFEILKKYLEAEAEGRMMALPCKVGDMVYYRRGLDILGDTVERIILDGIDNQVLVGAHKAFMFWDFGRNVFLTREEAEAALKGENK